MWPPLFFFILIVFADRILKIVVFKNFSPGTSFPLIKDILHITPIYNKGIAFGLFREYNLFIFIAASSVAVIFMVYTLFFKRPKSALIVSGLVLIAAGAIGNLIDRLVYGHVLDFIDIRVWPVFNIADSSITIGASLILLHLFKK